MIVIILLPTSLKYRSTCSFERRPSRCKPHTVDPCLARTHDTSTVRDARVLSNDRIHPPPPPPQPQFLTQNKAFAPGDFPALNHVL